MAEKEYIEREAGLTELCRGCSLHSADDNFFCGSACPKYERIAAIPAADVKPVVRGRWRFEEGDGETCSDGWVCSACGCGFHTHVPYFEDFNFCPNCGADMREE